MTWVLVFAMIFGHFDRVHFKPGCGNGLPECVHPYRGGGE